MKYRRKDFSDQCANCKNSYDDNCLEGITEYPNAADCYYYNSIYVATVPGVEDVDGNDWD